MTDQTLPLNLLHTLIKGEALKCPVVDAADGRQHLILPDGFKAQDITDPHRLPPRAKAAVTVDDRASLSAYINRFSSPQSVIFADYTAGTITAILDWHHDNEASIELAPGALGHKVQLKMQPSEEFTRWNKMAGNLHPQADFAVFLEENAMDITDPSPTEMIELSRDLEAVSGQSFKARTRLENGDTAFQFETDSKIVSRVQAPQRFILNIPVWHGEEPEQLTALFRWKATPAGLLLGFVWHRVEYMRRARFALVAATAAEETALPYFFGRP